MLATNHVLAGALIGAHCPSVPTAAAAGFVSHFAMDSIPHWGCIDPDRWMTVARMDGAALLVAVAAVAASAPRTTRARMLAGALGALAPDLNKPSRILLGRSCWPAAVDRFHAAIQTESERLMPAELAAGAGLSAAVACTIRRDRRA